MYVPRRRGGFDDRRRQSRAKHACVDHGDLRHGKARVGVRVIDRIERPAPN